MNNSMTVEGSVSFATLGMDTAAYLDGGLPGGEMSTDFSDCILEVTLDAEDPSLAHIKYTDGFPDQQTINLTYWKPGCPESSLMYTQVFTQGWELLEWVQDHMPGCTPAMYELTLQPITVQNDGLQLIGLRTPDMFAIVGCAYPLGSGV